MLRRTTTRRRLLRKRMYKAPHSRHRVSEFKRENKSLVKPHQEKFRAMNGPQIKRKRRPKREVMTGFKMSYRYKYYQNKLEEQNDEEDDLE